MKSLAVRLVFALAALASCLLLSGCPEPMSDLELLIRDGDDFFHGQKYEKAVLKYTEALELSPGMAGIHVNRGNAYSMMAQEDKALADYNEAIRLDDQLAVAYANRGILRDNRKDWKGALADYRKVLELDPELAEAPSVWKRILYSTPSANILDRIKLLEKMEEMEALEAQDPQEASQGGDKPAQSGQ